MSVDYPYSDLFKESVFKDRCAIIVASNLHMANKILSRFRLQFEFKKVLILYFSVIEKSFDFPSNIFTLFCGEQNDCDLFILNPPEFVIQFLTINDSDKTGILFYDILVTRSNLNLCGRACAIHCYNDIYLNLEDKTYVHNFWIESGIHFEGEVIPTSTEKNVIDTIKKYIQNSPVGLSVVSYDASYVGSGGNGSGMTVVNELSNLSNICRYGKNVRIMPFYPAQSIELTGVVFKGRVVILKSFIGIFALELIHDNFKFVDLGASFLWIPTELENKILCDVVHKCGLALNKRGFKGFFNINGVLYDNKFIPTEINPRPPMWFTGFWNQCELFDAVLRGECVELHVFDMIENHIKRIWSNINVSKVNIHDVAYYKNRQISFSYYSIYICFTFCNDCKWRRCASSDEIHAIVGDSRLIKLTDLFITSTMFCMSSLNDYYVNLSNAVCNILGFADKIFSVTDISHQSRNSL